MKKLIVFLVLLSSAFITLSPAPQATHATAALPPIAGLEAAYSQTIGDDDVQYHSVRHAAGYQAENPAQGYTTTFGAEGITVSTEAWSWSMQLQGYDMTLPIAEANTTTYERDGLTEWYINGPVGLEQGFTLHEPAGRIATLELALLGDLTPTLVDEQTMILQTASGVTALRYYGLVAYDATHRQLPAWLALDGVLQIHVDTSGAIYPVTIDPWVETQKLTASDAEDNTNFGFSVAIAGTRAIVGARFEDSMGTFSGAAYIFTESGGVWSQQAKLTASDAEDNDQFGFSVAIAGTTAIVGTPYDDDAGTASGAAYVFTESGGVWTEQAKLTASDAGDSDWFGFSVAIDSTTVAIGAHGEDSAGAFSGAAYIFTESGGVWTEQTKLTASDAESTDQFGYSVAIDGTTVAVGTPEENGSGTDRGAAYIFTESGGIWTEQAKLTAADAGDSDWFGVSIAIDGATVIVGAYGEDGTGTDSGAAYIFTESGGVWTEQAKLTAADAESSDIFGLSVAIASATIIVGAPYDDDAGTASGAAYIFTESGGVWSQQAKLTAADAEGGDVFGFSVAIASATIIVGAPYESSAGTNNGATYVFMLTPLTATAACDATTGNLVVDISEGDGPFDITGTGPGLPLSGVSAGTHTLTGPGGWTGVTVTETGGDLEVLPLGDYTCAAPTTLTATASCDAATGNLVVNITGGDGPFDITGTGPGLPLSGVSAGTHTLIGPGGWTGVTVTETGGDLEVLPLGDYTCAAPTTLTATASCDAATGNLVVNITGGDGPFDITGTGPGLPLSGVSAGTHTMTGPGAWTNVTVTETGGDLETLPLGDYTCAAPTTLTATAACDAATGNLVVDITGGDGPFDITGTGPGLPLSGVSTGTHTLTGPGAWTGVTVTETGGDSESLPLGDFTCAAPTALTASASCDAATGNLVVNIAGGDGPFDITGTGPGLPLNGVGLGTHTLTGPGGWTGVTVTETGGDTESLPLGDFTCAAPTTLTATASCDAATGNLVVNITGGDGPFDITGTGPGLPLSGVSAGTHTMTGPGAWTNVTVTETGGDTESLPFGDYTCAAPTTLTATASCDAATGNLVVNITGGDGPFDITGTGPGLPLSGVSAGTHTLTGPGGWTNVTVTETGGDTESLPFGDYTCAAPTTLTATASCDAATGNLVVNITGGDGPFDITGTGPGLPLSGVSTGTHTMTGPGGWTGVIVTETGGDMESLPFGDYTCAAPTTLTATAICDGVTGDLVVDVTGGDGPFDITGTGPDLPLSGVSAGTHTMTGPGPWLGVTITETTGDLESLLLGDFTCETLAASAVCNGDNLDITVTSGNAPFDITGNGTGLPISGVSTGTQTLTGPDTWTDVTVTETAGDLESLLLGDFTCEAPEPEPPPSPPPTVIDPALSKIGILQPGQLGLPGEQITWTITATAPSNADLNNVVISDTFRGELQIDGVTTTAGTVIINGQTVTVTIPVMAAGSSVTIQVTTTVLSSPVEGIFENTVTLTADGGVFLTATATVSVVTGLPDTGYPPQE